MKKHKIALLNFLLAATIIALVVAVCVTIRDYADYRTVKRDALKLSDTVRDQNNGKDFAKLKKINPDIAAWVQIPDTAIDYPVVMAEDNSYYLSHNIRRQADKYGALFIDSRVRNPFMQPYQNCIIYGHNMGRNATVMFSELMKYQDPAFYRKHDTVKIFTTQKPEGADYQILAVKQVTASSDTFHTEFPAKAEFNAWLSKQCDSSLYRCRTLTSVTGVVTLSTCTNDGQSRFVLICAANNSEAEGSGKLPVS